jgi:hypothetical protein
MATKKEYIEAAVERIRDWCKSTDCKIPDIAYMSIHQELRTMFEAGILFVENKEQHTFEPFDLFP